MKILIVSDTHGNNSNLQRVLDKVKPIDMMIHLGDLEGYENQIRTMAGCYTEIVAGNNDFFSNLDKEKEIQIGKYRVLITHGHYYNVNFGPEFIMEEGKAREKDIVMYGHTHKPAIEYGDNIIALNPGSLSYPRQEGRRPSYIIMDLDRSGQAHFTINYL